MVLRKIALEEITEKGVSVTEFHQTLMIMPSYMRNEKKHFINSLFQKAESIESIFLEINFFLPKLY